MSKSDELIILYQGAQIEIKALEEFLYQNEIPSLIRDDYQSSMLAGWISPASSDNIKIFVTQKDFLQAKYLLEKFLKGE